MFCHRCCSLFLYAVDTLILNLSAPNAATPLSTLHKRTIGIGVVLSLVKRCWAHGVLVSKRADFGS